ncbi:MAG: monooxygenase [Sulfobacillus acidophilus]|uniref:Monooxygenase n=1 Tax=Sulfobacillus acidophilus TaxID=53633 RepID=A0A2T2WJG6_9FIRM|nr:MAG: monooxygenase [Sulfobacillus acidophilus]
MTTCGDVIVVGRGPAGLLFSSLVAQNRGSVILVADAQGSFPLWGGQWDFCNYTDDGEHVLDPYQWWQQHPSAWDEVRDASTWTLRWQHLMTLWQEIGIPVPDRVPKLNRWMVTPLGQLRPTYWVANWHFVMERPGPLVFVDVPGLVDFRAEVVARVYTATTGQMAKTFRLAVPSGWRRDWHALNWAWFLDSKAGQDWLGQALRDQVRAGEEAVVFPQILGVDHCEEVLEVAQRVLGRPVAEVPLPPPAVGGIRIQRRWEYWLRRHGIQLVSARVTAANRHSVTLQDGRALAADAVVLATGGILGGGLEIQPSGSVRNTVTGAVIGTLGDQLLGAVGHRNWDESVPVIGRMIQGWNPDKRGNGGAMNLWTAHVAYQAFIGHTALAREN